MNILSFGPVVSFACVAALGHAQSGASESIVKVRDVRALIEEFARLRNSLDGNAVAEIYTIDADYIGAGGWRVHGRVALATMWRSVKGEARRTITSVDLLSPHVAVVHGLAEFNDSGPLSETFVVLWKDRQWLIAIHEAAFSQP